MISVPRWVLRVEPLRARQGLMVNSRVNGAIGRQDHSRAEARSSFNVLIAKVVKKVFDPAARHPGWHAYSEEGG